jgi:hypothetical protein
MAKVVRLGNFGSALLAATLATGAVPALADSAHATLDAAGTRAVFTGMARVTCFNDGNGNAATLVARIRDNSDSIHGLMVNLQLIKASTALSISDEISGDAAYSDYISLPGGNGEYLMLVNKTAAGRRNFDLEWHCMTADNVHTGTDISLLQFK